jgi:DNA-directed RNA polymerase specialized sigma24 family protein
LTGKLNNKASEEEVQAAIDALDKDAFLKLGHVATRFIHRTLYRTPMDLLQDALVAALELRREWCLERSFYSFLCLAMRSIASNDRMCLQTRSECLATELVNETEMDADRVLADADCRLNVQNRLADEVEEEAQAAYRRRAHAVLELFADDDHVTLILRAMEEGYRGHEIAEQCGLTAAQYSTARRRMNRRLNSVYPGRASS